MRAQARPELRPALLHNSGAPSSTTARWDTGGIGRTLVRFSLGASRVAHLARAPLDRSRGTALDAAWRGYRLRGAALIYEGLPAQDPPALENSRATLHLPQKLSALDDALVLNVLGRACAGLLLSVAPLDLSRPWLARELWSDDERLVALARASGTEPLS